MKLVATISFVVVLPQFALVKFENSLTELTRAS